MSDERIDATWHVDASEATAALQRVREAAGRLDERSVAQPLVVAWKEAQQAVADLAALIDGLPATGPDVTRARSFFVLSRLDNAVSGALHVLATQAAERAVAAYRQPPEGLGGPVDTGEPD